MSLLFESFSNLNDVRRCFQGSHLGATLRFGLICSSRLPSLPISKAAQQLRMGRLSPHGELKHARDESSEPSFLLVTFRQELTNLQCARLSVFTAARMTCFCSMFQSTFQTVQLTAAAEIDTHNPELYVIEENAVTVSVLHPSLGQTF